jgi:hypothetical protein
MVQTLIKIGAQEYDASNLTLPSDKAFRDAWDTPVNNVVGIDADAKKEIMRGMVNEERDNRSAAGFAYNGKTFDFDHASIRRITGAAASAHIAVTLGGKQPGDLRWHDGATDFGWLAQDNTVMPMDAPTVIAFGQAAAAHEAAHIWAARALKDMAIIPDDFADDKYWP